MVWHVREGQQAVEEGKTTWSERRLQMVGAVAPQGARQCSEPVLVVTKQGDAGIEWAEAVNTAQTLRSTTTRHSGPREAGLRQRTRPG